MKKIIIFLALVVIAVSIIAIKYNSYRVEYNTTAKENAEYEEYKDKEIYGFDLVTVINKAYDKNTKNKIQKTEKGSFIPNDTNSIEIDIYTTIDEKTHKMEAIHDIGTEQFVTLFSEIKFKCSNIEYHKKTGKIRYMLFEQL